MENRELIQKAVNYAKANTADPGISIGDIAAHAGFTTDYFNRIFLAHTGFTVMAYMNFIRTQKATVLLRTTDSSILDIALAVGYDSHEGFLKAFKRCYGVTPSEFREQKKKQILAYGDMTDPTAAARFLHENPDLQAVDSNAVIDYLLAKDAKRYGYFCTSIKYMGLTVAAEGGNMESGMVAIEDDRSGGVSLELLTEDPGQLSKWLKRFPDACFDSILAPAEMHRALTENGIEGALSCRPQWMYFGDPLPCALPEGITVQQLTAGDREQILHWANGRKNGYIVHLLTESHYADENCLDYGVFRGGEMIAAVGCGIDEVHGFRLNNGCKITDLEDNSLYRPIFAWVVNDILERGVLPFDDIQQGEHARSHGNFTSEDMGFTLVNRQYSLKK